MCAHIKAQCVDFDIDVGLQRSVNKTRRMLVVEPKNIVKEVMLSFRSAPTTNHRLRRWFHVRLDHLHVFNAKKLLEALELYSQSDDIAIIDLCSWQPCHREAN